MKTIQKTIIILSVILSLALVIVSVFGAFIPSTYARETDSMAAQGIGQDFVDLFLVTPILLISLILMFRNNRPAAFVFGGTVFYILYSFIIYSFGIHFNRLFLLYCFILGASVYLFILYVIFMNVQDVKTWFHEKLPAKSTAVFLILVAIMFYLLWLKDLAPAIINNTIPISVNDYNLLVNPVHVIDLSFALPGLIVTAVLLLKKNKAGLILAPVALVFVLVMAIALAAMVVVLKLKGISDDTSTAFIFIVLALVSILLLIFFLKRLKTN